MRPAPLHDAPRLVHHLHGTCNRSEAVRRGPAGLQRVRPTQRRALRRPEEGGTPTPQEGRAFWKPPGADWWALLAARHTSLVAQTVKRPLTM